MRTSLQKVRVSSEGIDNWALSSDNALFCSKLQILIVVSHDEYIYIYIYLSLWIQHTPYVAWSLFLSSYQLQVYALNLSVSYWYCYDKFYQGLLGISNLALLNSILQQECHWVGYLCITIINVTGLGISV